MTRRTKQPEKPSSEQMTPGSLRSKTWELHLRGPDPQLLEKLYVPALSEAIRYDRCCAYFSSCVLAATARGFGKLIERLIAMGDVAPKPAVRLVVNEELAAEDVRALTEASDFSGLEKALKRRFKNPKDFLTKRRLAMLGWLTKHKYLDIRVGVMRYGGVYYTNNKNRMSYTSHLKHNLPIGSGVTEAACKTVVKQQMCVSGSRWKDTGASCVLALRTLKLTTGRWQQFWNYVMRHGTTLY